YRDCASPWSAPHWSCTPWTEGPGHGLGEPSDMAGSVTFRHRPSHPDGSAVEFVSDTSCATASSGYGMVAISSKRALDDDNHPVLDVGSNLQTVLSTASSYTRPRRGSASGWKACTSTPLPLWRSNPAVFDDYQIGVLTPECLR